MSTATQPSSASPLAERLDRHTAPGRLFRAEGAKVRCLACGHRCLIPPGGRGVCKLRANHAGVLRVPFGYTAGLACDPIEKKPFFHAHPGGTALTFGMLGCNLHCAFCQNWLTSQTLRDPDAAAPMHPATAEQIVDVAVREEACAVVSSYNEPLITAEWAAAVFQVARAQGLLCAFVSNGHATPEVIEFLQPWLNACKVDLKTFDDQRYRQLGGTLKSVTQTIEQLYERKIWLEVLTLLIPGFNDDEAQLRGIARFLAGISRDIPWHLTAFHPDYRLTSPRRTTARDLLRAAEIGAGEGLRYVYAGNLPGSVGGLEDTRCPGCGTTLVARCGFTVSACHLTAEGLCPNCQTRIPGLWPARPNPETLSLPPGLTRHPRAAT